jgi:hypothetical protein
MKTIKCWQLYFKAEVWLIWKQALSFLKMSFSIFFMNAAFCMMGKEVNRMKRKNIQKHRRNSTIKLYST